MPPPEASNISESPVPSPCVSVCQMDVRSGLCRGCLRTIDEIAAWSRYAEAEKRTVLARIAERRTRG